MALDHYISQVHLKNFHSPELGNKLMYAIRKTDLKSFTPNSKSVCRIEDGSTNAYLREDRLVEEFLQAVEPKYNTAVRRLAEKDIDPEVIFVIAGFVSYVLTCSPAGMRINSALFKGSVEETARIIEQHEGFPPPPPELGGKTLFELLDSGKVRVNIDPKYPQAMGIAGILSFATSFGNFKWEVLQNTHEESPFFTSEESMGSGLTFRHS